MSLSLCPECEAELEDDFGLVECSSCGTQVLVGEEVVAVSNNTVEDDSLDPVESLSQKDLVEEGSSEEVAVEEVYGFPQESSLESAAEESIISDVVNSEEVYQEDNLPDFLAEVIDEPTDDYEGNNPLGDIEAFANEELTADGTLVYDLVIEGVDTPEIRNALIGILNDSKFQWDIEELVASIKLGVLNIYSLNPVKAYLVVTQARRLPIKLAWKQRSIV